jgi:heme/copper-type cytochrome/quinol oxidase subunit 1
MNPIHWLVAWFVGNPVDVMFTAGGVAFAVSGLKGICNSKTRVDRWSSGPTAVVLTCYLAGYFHSGFAITMVPAVVGAFNWWFLYFRRYVGMPEVTA